MIVNPDVPRTSCLFAWSSKPRSHRRVPTRYQANRDMSTCSQYHCNSKRTGRPPLIQDRCMSHHQMCSRSTRPTVHSHLSHFRISKNLRAPGTELGNPSRSCPCRRRRRRSPSRGECGTTFYLRRRGYIGVFGAFNGEAASAISAGFKAFPVFLCELWVIYPRSATSSGLSGRTVML